VYPVLDRLQPYLDQPPGLSGRMSDGPAFECWLEPCHQRSGGDGADGAQTQQQHRLHLDSLVGMDAASVGNATGRGAGRRAMPGPYQLFGGGQETST
jgi:hypothetical protein